MSRCHSTSHTEILHTCSDSHSIQFQTSSNQSKYEHILKNCFLVQNSFSHINQENTLKEFIYLQIAFNQSKQNHTLKYCILFQTSINTSHQAGTYTEILFPGLFLTYQTNQKLILKHHIQVQTSFSQSYQAGLISRVHHLQYGGVGPVYMFRLAIFKLLQ